MARLAGSEVEVGLRSLQVPEGVTSAVFGGRDLAEAWLERRDGLLWVDLDGTDPAMERVLLRRFGIDDLAIDDCQRDRHPPKLEWFQDYFFLLMKGFSAETHDVDFEVVHISFFVGESLLITRHSILSPSIERVWSLAEHDELALDRGAAHVCYRVVRTIIDRYAPIILDLEERLDELEEQVLDRATDETLAELVSYNSRLKKMRRIFNYQTAILQQLRSAPDMAGAGVDHEFNDAHEQMERLTSLAGLLQELAVELIDGYISLSSYRQNQIMKTLTVTAVIFMPLTFVAGIYGMNFANMPELEWRFGYFVVLALMLTVGGGLLLFFRRLRWL